MNIIFVGKYRGKPVRCQIGGHAQLVVFCLCVTICLSLLSGAGYLYGMEQGKLTQLSELESELVQQKVLINKARFTAQSDLDALAGRIGSMHAQVTRLNALGERLIKVSRIDPKEFDFKNAPAYGGPHEPAAGTTIDLENVMSDLNDSLFSREEQLSLLEDVLVSKQLRKESKPQGRPIKKGWISSYYGKRTDPFTGRLAMHKGMDFASKAGTNILSVANGVVVWAGPRYGYGTLIEVNHGNGYTTRYGHNEKLLVEVGNVVEKGQPISLMGSSGRSTGPHVHFEVLKNNRQIDPIKFVLSNG